MESVHRSRCRPFQFRGHARHRSAPGGRRRPKELTFRAIRPGPSVPQLQSTRQACALRRVRRLTTDEPRIHGTAKRPPVRPARKAEPAMTGLSKYRGIGILLARVTVGWVFFYAGIEKVFGATPFTAAGFLKFGTLGTTAEKVAD